jgi:hypothetical protein
MWDCTLCKNQFTLDDMAIRGGGHSGICIRCWHSAVDDDPQPRRLSKIDREIADFVNKDCNPPAYRTESI